MLMYLYNSNISLSELPRGKIPVTSIGMKSSYDGWYVNFGGLLFLKNGSDINLVKVTKKVSDEVSIIKQSFDETNFFYDY